VAGIVSLGGVTVIHLTYDQGSGEQYDWRIACMPEITDFRTAAHHPNYLRSNDTRAVTCQECKKTKVFERVRSTER
jgi:hypothetical protein